MTVMNYLLSFFFMVFFLGFPSCKRMGGRGDAGSRQVIKPEPDTTSLIRNPAMGWVLYDDASTEVADANTYWTQQDEATRKYASIFYIRWRWSDMEPEEGKYAWLYNDNFKALIKGAKDRGLKLAFRVYVDGQDNIRPGTPLFVKQAGAQGYEVTGGGKKHWTPYLDDPVFQAKLGNFIKAFAEEFDDPAAVDFVDGYNLGWWGEGHHLVFKDPANKRKVFNWIINLYGNHFKKVLLAITFNSEIGYAIEKETAFEGQGYVFRRDGLGSKWFTQEEKAILQQAFPRYMFIGESCYWGHNTDDKQPWKDDPVYPAGSSWVDVYHKTFRDAITFRANCLDLREPVETKGWTTRAPELVEAFVKQGGYRLYPPSISLPASIKAGEAFSISHQWKNIGVGVCPNNNKRWSGKYRVAFALIDKSTAEVVGVFEDEKANPGDWIKGNIYNYTLQTSINNITPGEYHWAVAIINTMNDNKPGIAIAVKDPDLISGWVRVGEVLVK